MNDNLIITVMVALGAWGFIVPIVLIIKQKSSDREWQNELKDQEIMNDNYIDSLKGSHREEVSRLNSEIASKSSAVQSLGLLVDKANKELGKYKPSRGARGRFVSKKGG